MLTLTVTNLVSLPAAAAPLLTQLAPDCEIRYPAAGTSASPDPRLVPGGLQSRPSEFRKNGRITGLFRRAEIARQLEEGNIQCRAHVSDEMEALSEENIVSSGASVLTFIETADYHPCRLVLRKTAIDGIITISDLQRLPVRPVLFF